MSFFDRQGIPEALLRNQGRTENRNGGEEAINRDGEDSESNSDDNESEASVDDGFECSNRKTAGLRSARLPRLHTATDMAAPVNYSCDDYVAVSH